ncbi:asparagine synthetase B [Bowmanella sp. JS7-9]|uniref:asparagine synthase (glutamine-hydrolyzing) n=1 Tax=Pseudobowmanella zhangzhouensis TaxID=1537679 RepID=A0ABW1XIV2_9ALTE|nr:asparagine synthase-related protein [Bowmanella sp. JS7-9]TBX20852.1 asparagine synthase [Bowmanella sp. JS7-9]
MLTRPFKQITLILPEQDLLDNAESDDAFLAIRGAVYLNGQKLTAQTALQHLQKHSDITDVLGQFSGHFWLIYQDKQHIWLANDHMGLQPCYHTLQNNRLVVAGKLNALKSLDNLSFTLSNQAIYQYFYFHCIPSPQTIYQEVAKLEPGMGLCWQDGTQPSSTLIYNPDFTQKLDNTATSQQQCLDILQDAVAQQMDDSTGAFLSGGLDSSSVAGKLAAINPQAKTFSIGFRAKGYDETEFALITANHFNTDHQVLYLEPDQALEKFVEIAQYFDEPFGNSSAMAAYFCAKFAKEHGIHTLLAGDGGDEIFAGNERYAKQKIFEPYLRVPGFIRAINRGIFVKSPLATLPGFKKIASYIRQAETRLPLRLQTHNFIYQIGAENIFADNFLRTVNQDLPAQQLKARYESCKSNDPTNAMLFLDWKFTLADNDLVKVNTMCEMAGVNVAYPFLTREMVDFSCDISANAKLPGQKLRHFYRSACRGFLADETLDKEKHGFGLPFGVWLHEHEGLKNLALESLQKFRKRNILNGEIIDKVLEAHTSVHASYYGVLIWIIVVLELWLQRHEGD